MNEAENPTDTSVRLVPFTDAHAEKLELIVMPEIWDRFITILESKTFTLDEITREHKRIKNLHGSVEEHRKAFMEAVETVFHVGLSK